MANPKETEKHGQPDRKLGVYVTFAPFLSWSDLKSDIDYLHTLERYRREFGLIRNYPLATQSIDDLVQNKWRVHLGNEDVFATYYDDKVIIVREGSTPYERDQGLFHELTHACYGRDTLNDEDGWSKGGRDLNAITEWAARRSRANPWLLKHAVTSFGLEPQVYDRSSFIAFDPRASELVRFLRGQGPKPQLDKRVWEIIHRVQMERSNPADIQKYLT